MPQHVADLVEFQAAQRRPPLGEFRRTEALLRGQTVELLVDPRVEEQFPISEQDLAARPLLEDLAVGTLQQDDVFRQVLGGVEPDLAAIGDIQQVLPRNDVGLAMGNAETHARQRSVQPHHPPQQPRQHEPRGRLDGPQSPLQVRQADPRITGHPLVGGGELCAVSARPFPGFFHGWDLGNRR